MTGSNPQSIRPPSHLARAEKLAFRRVVSQLTEAETPPIAAQTDAIVDLVRTRARLEMLHGMLGRQHPESEFGADRKVILELVSQVNATTALAGRLASRIGLVSDGRKA